MITFSLITEGITDQIVIENILCGIFNSPDLIIFPWQPTRDETDKNRATSHSDWFYVLDFCQSKIFQDGLPYYDYVIIQIDTDVSEEKHFDVSHREDGNDVPPEQLIERVVARLIRQIGEDIYKEYPDKFIFAVAVHSIECWLLPIVAKTAVRTKIVNCLGTLNHELSAHGKFTIDPDSKNPKYYREISKIYRKNRTLHNLYTYNPSLKFFIESILKMDIDIS